jgi:hypothetical protein
MSLAARIVKNGNSKLYKKVIWVYTKYIPKQKSKMSQRSTASLYYSLISFTLILGVFSVSGLAQSSANYILGGGLENGGGQSISGNFIQNCNQISGGAIGQGSSSNYSITSGINCKTSTLSLNLHLAPEKRVVLSHPNLAEDTIQLKLYLAGTHILVYTHLIPISINQDGYTTSIIQASVAPGQYDIAIKSAQHLTSTYKNQSLNIGMNTLDLTNSMTVKLKAGDVNGVALGDDTINALDISKEVSELGGSTAQQDLNRDGRINVLDIGILLANYGQNGN